MIVVINKKGEECQYESEHDIADSVYLRGDTSGLMGTIKAVVFNINESFSYVVSWGNFEIDERLEGEITSIRVDY